jgi:hypothetical protein
VAIPGSAPTVRAFGRWLAVVVSEDNRKTRERISPGKEHRSQTTAAAGFSADDRFGVFERYYPGNLILYNVDTQARIEFTTGQGDSEVLLISGSVAYYRVNDSIYKAEIGESGISKPTLLAQSEAVADVHWAFLSK